MVYHGKIEYFPSYVLFTYTFGFALIFTMNLIEEYHFLHRYTEYRTYKYI